MGGRKDCHLSANYIQFSPPPTIFLFFIVIICCFSSALASSEGYNYKDVLSKSFLYLEAQRSGRLPHNQRVTWRDHSGLTDGLEQGVDLVGGYYDAGDHVKFGLPMAFTVTMLSWSIIEYGDLVEEMGEMANALAAIKWGTDYFLKAHTDPNVLWGEVGDGGTDHYCWQRAEDMTTSRQAYKVDAEHPGSDLAGETAAAMAAASMVFKKFNPHYSHLLLHHAQELFSFADNYRGKYDASIDIVKNYYPSISGYNDELLWAALWLHRATGNGDYLKYAVHNADSFGGTGWAMTEFSWDVKYAGVQILASKVLMEGKHNDYAKTLRLYQSKAEHYLCSCLQKNKAGNVHLTPGGLLFIREWNNMQYVSNAAFLLTIYSDYLRQFNQTLHCENQPLDPDELMDFAETQLHYILGSNPMGMSYLVGFGPKYPKFVHHRGASVISYRHNPGFIGCTQGYDNWYGSPDPNPNILVGALVGGPDAEDLFNDDRAKYMQTEACTYNTVPLVGVIAKLNHDRDNGLFPQENQQVSSY